MGTEKYSVFLFLETRNLDWRNGKQLLASSVSVIHKHGCTLQLATELLQNTQDSPSKHTDLRGLD